MSGTVLAVALLSGTIITTGVAVPICGAAVTASAVAAAADAAALAAADAASGWWSGPPCERAAALAAANRSRLVGCVVDGAIATVLVERAEGVLVARAAATAGPAP